MTKKTAYWKNIGKHVCYESFEMLSKINEKLSKFSNKSTFRLSVAREIKTKVILTANQKREKYPLRANEDSKSIHLKAFPSEPLIIYA